MSSSSSPPYTAGYTNVSVEELRKLAAAGSAKAKYFLFGKLYGYLLQQTVRDEEQGEAGLSSSRDVPTEALTLLKDAAKKGGFANAQYTLGCVHFFGLMNVKQDHVKAVRWLKKAAAQDFEAAKEKLASCYFKGIGVEEDLIAGLHISRSIKGVDPQNRGHVQEYVALAEQGDVTAQLRLASIYSLGSYGVVVDWERAWFWVRKAGEGEDAHGQYSLGGWYDAGMYGVRRNRRAAAALWIKAAAKNHVMAMANLGVYYENGFGGLRRDLKKAVELFRLAADGGNGIAQLNLGDYYEAGKGGLERDVVKAATLWRQSAAQGLTESYKRLAECHMKGIGVEMSWKEATSYLLKGACQGDEWSVRNLCDVAEFYVNGNVDRGITKDLKRAKVLFKACASQGNSTAIARLGSRDCAACGAKNPTKACPLCICTNYCSKVGRWQRIIILHRYRL